MTYDVSTLASYGQVDEDMGVSLWPDPNEFIEEIETFEPQVPRRFSVRVSQNPFRQEIYDHKTSSD